MRTPTSGDLDEYTALRATIRERGTARVCIFALGIPLWAALTIATAAVAATPLGTLVPLLALAAVFEAVYALHIGVERVGRYLQVFHEVDEPDGRRWEHVAMTFGRPKGGATIDPLFTIPFALAAVLNLIPALIVLPTVQELVFVGGAHALFGIRLFVARAAAADQRKVDLARFSELKSGLPPP